MSNKAKELMEKVAQAPNREHSNVVPLTDPVVETEMVCQIHDVNFYDKNPRTIKNEKYDDLRLSIAQRGFTGVMEITRRPGAESYMVAAGSNTTLGIIKELHEETGDNKFSKIRCLFKPWQGESEVLFSHLIENATQGRMVFIDKAQGTLNAKSELEKELGKSLGLREFCKLSTESGYKVNPSMFSKYQYAADVLGSVLPLALESGMGKHQIENIKKFQTSIEKYLKHRGFDAKNDADVFDTTRQAYFDALAAHDKAMDPRSEDGRKLPGWSFLPVEKQMQEYIAKEFDIPFQDVRLDLATIMDKGEIHTIDLPAHTPLLDKSKSRGSSNGAKTTKTNSAAESTVATNATQSPKSESASSTPEAPSTVSTGDALVDFTDFDESDGGIDDIPTFDGTDGEPEGNDDLAQAARATSPMITPPPGSHRPAAGFDTLRSTFVKYASVFAEAYGLSDLLHPIDQGPGVYLEVPEEPFYTDNSLPPTQQGCAWYLLAMYTEQVYINPQITERLPVGSTYKFYMEKAIHAHIRAQEGQLPDEEYQDLDPLFSLVGYEPGVQFMLREIYASCDQTVLEAMMNLQRIHWQMREYCREKDLVTIWEAES